MENWFKLSKLIKIGPIYAKIKLSEITASSCLSPRRIYDVTKF